MSSSTSNSDFKYLLRVFLLTLFCIIVYGVTTRDVSFSPFTPQSQFQENKYKTEHFLNRINSITPSEYTIIVGSSLSTRLKEEYFQGKTINFSFGGGSALTGLEFILKSGAKFKRVLIDATILRPKDKEMIEILESESEKWRIHHLLFTNVDHQPVSLLSNFIKGKLGSSHENESDHTQLEQWIEFQQKTFGALKDKDRVEFQESLQILKSQVAQIEEGGMEVYFVEMPMDPRVSSIPFIDLSKKEVAAAFSTGGKTHWILPSPKDEYQTVDGLHLTAESALNFAKELDY